MIYLLLTLFFSLPIHSMSHAISSEEVFFGAGFAGFGYSRKLSSIFEVDSSEYLERVNPQTPHEPVLVSPSADSSSIALHGIRRVPERKAKLNPTFRLLRVKSWGCVTSYLDPGALLSRSNYCYACDTFCLCGEMHAEATCGWIIKDCPTREAIENREAETMREKGIS